MNYKDGFKRMAGSGTVFEISRSNGKTSMYIPVDGLSLKSIGITEKYLVNTYNSLIEEDGPPIQSGYGIIEDIGHRACLRIKGLLKSTNITSLRNRIKLDGRFIFKEV